MVVVLCFVVFVLVLSSLFSFRVYDVQVSSLTRCFGLLFGEVVVRLVIASLFLFLAGDVILSLFNCLLRSSSDEVILRLVTRLIVLLAGEVASFSLCDAVKTRFRDVASPLSIGFLDGLDVSL